MNSFENMIINTPFSFGKITMRNRIVMPPMETRMNTIVGDPMKEANDYYEERAKGGCGMIIVENTYVDNIASRSSLASSGLYSDHVMPSHAMQAEAIKAHGCLAVIQLSHGGLQAGIKATGLDCLGPSAVASSVVGRVPRPLTVEEIHEIEDAFAAAAERAQRCGYDGVEIHAAHGYLLNEFLSPKTNKRTDEYGGSFENRLRIVKETLEKVRAAVGPRMIVGLRISVDEFTPDGLKPDEACQFVKGVESLLSYVHCSAGTYETKAQGICQPVYQPAGKLLPLAAQMKQTVSIPVIAVGSLDYKLAEEALEKGYCDLVAIGRQQVCDPEFAKKVCEGRFDDIRPCCRGNEGCQSGFFKVYPIRCEFNPAAGRENRMKLHKATTKKHIVVIGGGCAGMEAARVADLCGHRVTLLEKKDHLGGHFDEAVLPPFKGKTGEFCDWQKRQLAKGATKVVLNAKTSPEDVMSYNPDAVIVAVGSNYLVPPVAGVENAIFADDALFHQEKATKTAIVIGGGLVGSEVAITWAENKGTKVTLVEMLPDLAPGMDFSARVAMKERMVNDGVDIHCSTKVKEIKKGAVVCEDKDGNEITYSADTVIIAMGLVADSKNAAQYDNLGVPTFKIGDCVQARNFSSCNSDAWTVVLQLSE